MYLLSLLFLSSLISFVYSKDEENKQEYPTSIGTTIGDDTSGS